MSKFSTKPVFSLLYSLVATVGIGVGVASLASSDDDMPQTFSYVPKKIGYENIPATETSFQTRGGEVLRKQVTNAEECFDFAREKATKFKKDAIGVCFNKEGTLYTYKVHHDFSDTKAPAIFSFSIGEKQVYSMKM